MPNFRGGGGYSATEKSQSTKIYLNMNFPKGGGILQLKSQSAKINAKSGGGGYSEAHLVFCMGSVYV